MSPDRLALVQVYAQSLEPLHRLNWASRGDALAAFLGGNRFEWGRRVYDQLYPGMWPA